MAVVFVSTETVKPAATTTISRWYANSKRSSKGAVARMFGCSRFGSRRGDWSHDTYR